MPRASNITARDVKEGVARSARAAKRRSRSHADMHCPLYRKSRSSEVRYRGGIVVMAATVRQLPRVDRRGDRHGRDKRFHGRLRLSAVSISDVRLAVRGLVKTPGFSVTVVLTL